MIKSIIKLFSVAIALVAVGCSDTKDSASSQVSSKDFKLGTGHAVHADPLAAAKEATAMAIKALGDTPVKGVIFYENFKFHPKEKQIGKVVADMLPEGVQSIGVRAIPHTDAGTLWTNSVGVMAFGGEDAHIGTYSAKLVDTRMELGKEIGREMSKVKDLSLVMALAEMNMSFAPNYVSVEDLLLGMQSEIGEDVKVFGGNGEPDNFPTKKESVQFINGQALEGHVVLMGIGGPIRLIGNNTNEFKVGDQLITATAATGKWVHTFDGRSAASVYRELSGKKPSDPISYDQEDPIGVDLGNGQVYLRMVLFEVKDPANYTAEEKEKYSDYIEESKGMPLGSLRFVADVPVGTKARVLVYQKSAKEIIDSASEAVKLSLSNMKEGEKPLAMLTSSCCARRSRLRTLDPNADEVKQGILPAMGEETFTVFGLDAWGELGPINRKYKGLPYQYQQHTFVSGLLVLK